MKRAVVVAGLAFGDEGKGTMTDYLTRRYRAELVVRYNGGPQAAHNVVTAEGVHHTFSQFGSGTLAGARTFLSQYMLIDPSALFREANVLETKGIQSPLRLVTVDPECVLITPWQRLAGQLRERARRNRHGSVGLGVGETRSDQIAGYAVHVRDIRSLTAGMLNVIRDRKLAEMEPLAEVHRETFDHMAAISASDVLARWEGLRMMRCASWSEAAAEVDSVIFEGAQGVLLDESYGFAPYTTWTDCTFANADRLIEEAPDAKTSYVGVLRSYFTRHGNGPFVTESAQVTRMEPHNGTHPFMGSFRTGFFDAVAARYAVQCVGRVDCLALTHADDIPSNQICTQYENGSIHSTAEELFRAIPRYQIFENVPEAIEELLGVPIRYLSFGLKASDKVDRVPKAVAA